MSDKKKVSYQLKKYCEKESYRKTLIIIIQLLIVVLTACETFAYNYLIDKVFVNSHFDMIYIPIILMIGIYILKMLLAYANQYEHNKFTLPMKENIRVHMLSIFYRRYDKEIIKDIGECKNCIEADVEELEKYYFAQYIEKYVLLTMIIVYFAGMLFYNYFLALVCCIIMLIPYFSVKACGSKIERESKDYRNLYGQYEGKLVQYIKNWKEIKSNNMQNECILDFRKDWFEMSKHLTRKAMYMQGNASIVSFNRFVLSQAVIYALGGWLIANDFFEIGGLLIFVNYYSKFLERISAFSDLNISLKNQKNSVDRVMEILELDILDNKSVNTINISSFDINHAYYCYDNADRYALEDISLKLHDKSLNVIVGKSGSGKSTLLKMLSGIIRPNKGCVFIGDIDITEISQESLYDKITVVLPDSQLFNMSIRENLLISNENATDEELLEACKKANIYEYIINLPEGLDTVLDEIAVNMSGGEKQRFAIARALCRNTDIYLFDEVSSSLDKENELYITNTIVELAKEHLVVFVTHRDMILDYADYIITIDEGKIIDSKGTLT